MSQNPVPQSTGGQGINIQLGGEVEFLKRDIQSIVEQDDKKLEFLIMPSVPGQSNPVTLQDFAQELDKFFNSVGQKIDAAALADRMAGALSPVLDVSALGLDLEQVFMHYLKSTAKDGPNLFEFGIKISIKNGKAKSGSLFQFKSFSLAVWNTNLPKILDSMHLRSIKDVLDSYK